MRALAGPVHTRSPAAAAARVAIQHFAVTEQLMCGQEEGQGKSPPRVAYTAALLPAIDKTASVDESSALCIENIDRIMSLLQ